MKNLIFRSRNETVARLSARRFLGSGYLAFGSACLVALTCGMIACLPVVAAQPKAVNPNASPERAQLEQQLIQVLSSNASPAEKDAACQKLKLIGTARCVPAVASLLPDQQLSHSARYVLESMPLTEAGLALIAGLNNTSGQIQVGIICSLGFRGESRAVPALAKIAKGLDEQTAIASADALGHIGSADAVKTLQALAAKKSGRVHAAAVDGLLRCAERLVATDRASRAFSIFSRIYETEKIDGVRLAAYRGMIRSASPGHSLRLVTRAISGPPSPAQLAALQMARQVQAAGATEALGNLLSRLDSPVQAALVGALTQRGDPGAVPALVASISTATPEVRVPILTALGQLGGGNVVPVLAQFAASGTPAEQGAARQALVNLRRGNVAETMVVQLASNGPGVQGELARALGDRGDRSALPRLFDLAQKGPESARKPAIKALGLLVSEAELPSLVQLLLSAGDAATRAQASESLNNACQRIVLKQGTLNAKPLVQAATSGSKEARIALFPVCSGLINPEVRYALRSGLEDADPEVSLAAARALCETIDPELVEDVITLARTSKDPKVRSLAVAGGVRLLTQEETVKISKGQRISSLRVLLGAAGRPEDRRLVLAGLGEMSDMEALRALEPFLADETLKSEAGLAASKIATSLPGAQAREALAILQRALPSAADNSSKQALEAALKQLQDSVDYITDWMVAGPFRQEGKNYAALFDIVFPPETDSSKGVEWKPLAAGTDPKRPYVMDLFKALGGQQCVAYARTWVLCEKDQAVLLDLGTDDGVKVWVNDKQVYALNTARPLQPGSDKVNLNLHTGWNMLLLKVTQNNLGWEFCARLLNPDGTHLDGVQIEAAPKATAASTN